MQEPICNGQIGGQGAVRLFERGAMPSQIQTNDNNGIDKDDGTNEGKDGADNDDTDNKNTIEKQLSDDVDVYDDEFNVGLGLDQMGSQDLNESTYDSHTTHTEPFQVELPKVEIKPRDPILPPRQVKIEETQDPAIIRKEKKKTKIEIEAEAAAEAARKELEDYKQQQDTKKSMDITQLQSTQLFSCLEF